MPLPPPHAVVWTEIPVTDVARSAAFYEAVIGLPLVRDESGPNPILMFPCADPVHGIAGHIYEGTPASGGPTVHLAVPWTVEEAGERCVAAGGTVLPGIVTIPAGRFAYATDPDGNSIGLFEPTAD